MLRILPFLAFLALSLALLVDSAHAAPVGQPVALSEADAPTWVAIVPARGHATPRTREATGQPCARTAHGRTYYGYATDAQTYGPTGAPYAAQRWDAREAVWYWHAHGRTRAVSYDGLTFFNPTRAPVLVALWCEEGSRTLRASEGSYID